VLELRQRLGLDSGYLSRLLRELEAARLVALGPDPEDGRRRVVRLTARGRRTWDALDRDSDAVANRLLAGLSPRQRDELATALAAARRLVRAATLTFDVVDPRSGAAVDSLRAYFAELDTRFPDGFDPGDAITADADAYLAPDGAFVLARSDGDAAACGAVMRVDSGTAEIKRMWVAPEWRGLGVGRRMLTTLEDLARDLRYRAVVLDTNDVLLEAIAMYRTAGYEETGRYNDNPYARLWFKKALLRRASSPSRGGRSRPS
jgi:GNAT superfamily N-acetyltransferase